MKSIRRGVSTVEYLIVLAGIVVACVGAAAFLGQFQSGISGHLDRLAVVRPPDAGANKSEKPRAAEPAEADEEPPISLASMLGLTVACFGLGFCVALGLFLHMRRKKRREAGLAAMRQPRRQADPGVIRRRMLDKRARINQILNREWESVARGEIRVRDLMTAQLKTVTPETPAESLRSLMVSAELHHMLVVGPAGELLGIVSDRDLNAREGDLASDLMTPNPATVAPDTDIRQAMTMMMVRHFSALPVVENGKLAGIITTNDLVATLHCTLIRLAEIARCLQLGQGRSMVELLLSNTCERQDTEMAESAG